MRWILLSLFCVTWPLGRAVAAEATEQQKIATAVDALTRLENFKLTNQNAALLTLAINQSTNETGVAAIRLVIANKDLAAVKQALQTTNVSDAARMVEALGNAKEKQAVPWLTPLIMNASNPE